MRAAIERAAATLVNGRDAPETGWLIEHGGGQGPLYWTGESWGKWSGDHRRACRFARREDAFKVSLTLGDPTDHPNGHKVVHHAWSDERAALTLSALSGDAGEGESSDPDLDRHIFAWFNDRYCDEMRACLEAYSAHQGAGEP